MRCGLDDQVMESSTELYSRNLLSAESSQQKNSFRKTQSVEFRVVRAVAEVMRVLARVRSELTFGFAQNNTQRQSGSLSQLYGYSCLVLIRCLHGPHCQLSDLCQTGRAQVQSVTCRAWSPWTSVEREDIVA